MWLARDKCGELCLYLDKPDKDDTCWINFDADFVSLGFTYAFPEVKWEDFEPTEVEITIKRRQP